jgi:SAM-dependent methyltransferase
MPREEALKDFYGHYYADTTTTTFDGEARFSRHLFSTLGVTPKANIRILDFGGGVNAELSRSLALQFIQRGTCSVEIALVDYNASCRRDWNQGITVDCYQTLPVSAEKFDIVVASAIVEHIPHPRQVILDLLDLLAPGGRAYFRTPAMASLVSLAARFGVDIDFTYPAHVHDMGQKFWENLLTSLNLGGFDLIHSRPSIVETNFSVHPTRTLLAYLLKLPWFALRKHYSFVGGWEAVFARRLAIIPQPSETS